MSRLRTAVIECKCKEVNRQLKEQVINGLNDNEILMEVIRKLTKCEEDVTIPIETVLAWTKRVEAQSPDSGNKQPSWMKKLWCNHT